MGKTAQAEPSEEQMERDLDDALLPAFVLGLVNISGPIDEQDKKRAEKVLAATETREALAAFFIRHKVASVLSGALESRELKRRPRGEEPIDELEPAMKVSIRKQLRKLEIPVSADMIADIVSDDIWALSQKRRAWAEAILRGEMPKQ